MNKIITKKEKQDLINIVQVYRDINKKLDNILKEIEILEEKKDNLIKEIKNTREEEKYYTNKLIEKYGDVITPDLLKEILI